ncbi:MAG: hypothetical protein DMG65_04780 [Candidatus Angelobacter sp. Gp1-AA117]|nr:MAG: hypothetical protein DMG65_04780 [Candidatus Angelobacter sp. Gp1-AA117]
MTAENCGDFDLMAGSQIRTSLGLLSERVHEWMNQGFALAYFIIPDRRIALEVLRHAMRKLDVQQGREEKRAYWRDKYLTRRITRTVRSGEDALQWLIYLTIEPYEKEQEQSGQYSVRDMVVRYVKSLLQMATAMSSFYVSVGLHRLLHSYSTSETQRIYESVTQHFPGQQEYRRVKGVLMNQLRLRFGSHLKVYRAEHGELRFQVFSDQHEWINLVEECLRMFIPWSTRNLCSATIGHLVQQLAGSTADYDSVELRRCHIFIDPLCHSKIINNLNLDSSRQRLAVPNFFLNGNDNDNKPERSVHKPAELSEQEQQAILTDLSEQTVRRQRCSLEVLRIVAHGREYARLNVIEPEPKQCWIAEGTRLIEVWTADHDGDVLVATHWLTYHESHGIARSKGLIELPNGTNVVFDTRPEMREENRGAILSISFRYRVPRFAWKAHLESIPMVPRFALIAVIILFIGSLISTLYFLHQLQMQESYVERIENQLIQEKNQRALLEKQIRNGPVAAYRLVPDDSKERFPGTREPDISLPVQSALLSLELPVGTHALPVYRARLTDFSTDREILTEKVALEKNGTDTFVRLQLPSLLIDRQKHYVVTLETPSATGRHERLRTFTFFVK